MTAATTKKQSAEQAATEAASAASAAADTDVDFGSYSFNSLNEGTCAQFWSDPSYTGAKKTAADAATAQTDADAEAKAVEASLQAAQEQAAKDVKACQCTVRAQYNQAHSAATEGVEADAAAYTKGKHMQCVLAGAVQSIDCKVGDVPKLQEITLAEGVPAEVCTTPSPAGSPTTSPATPPATAAPPPPPAAPPVLKCSYVAASDKSNQVQIGYYSTSKPEIKYKKPSSPESEYNSLNGIKLAFANWWVVDNLHPNVFKTYEINVFVDGKFEKTISTPPSPTSNLRSAPTSVEEADKLCDA